MAVLPVAAKDWGPQEGPRFKGTLSALGSSGATNKRMTRLLVEGLLAHGGMTTDYSCDATVAGTKGDGVNRWDSDADITGATPGTAHSWYVLLHTALGALCIDKDSAGDGGGGAPGSVFWSPAAGFTGGTTLARPTATDEREITTSTQLWTTANGDFSYAIWRCDQSGREAIRFMARHSTNAAGPDVSFYLEQAASTPAAWSPPVVARFRGGGAGSTFDRGNWTAAGWAALVSGTNRTPLLVGDTPPTAVDVDGDRLLVPIGLNDATIGRLGFLEDDHVVTDGVTDDATFSDSLGAGGWIVLDERVWPWDRTTVGGGGGGNIAGAKILTNYQTISDAVAPTITSIVPTPGIQPGEAGGFPADWREARETPITLHVGDAAPGLRFVGLWGQIIPGEDRPTFVIHDGNSFLWPFDSDVAARVVAGDGYDYTILPRGGWPKGSDPTFTVKAIDQAGNMEGPP
jgi:hypothetical protein